MRYNQSIGSTICAAALVVTAVPAPAEEAPASDLAGMFSGGKTSFDFRYRYEYVDDEAFAKEAKASTLRSRLTFASADYRGFAFLIEFDDVTSIGDDDYNSTNNGNTDYPVVADPEGTDVNQAWVKYNWGGTGGTFGRQRILHGDQRFIGGVGWRQNEQTYDGFRAAWSTETLAVDYAYVYNVNRIFGPDDGPVQPAELEGDNHFLRADWTVVEGHKLTGFAYSIEIDEDHGYPAGRSVDNSNRTFGVAYEGKIGPVSLKASYANQSDAGDSRLRYDADYYLVEGGLALFGLNATLGYEVLGAGDGVGFKTPYATLHKFQGWADKFLATPGDGIEDLYLGLTGKLGPLALGGFYHDFQAEDSSDDFGSELDLVITWPLNKMLSLQLKYASFSSDNRDRFTDTDKTWMTVNFKI